MPYTRKNKTQLFKLILFTYRLYERETILWIFTNKTISSLSFLEIDG